MIVTCDSCDTKFRFDPSRIRGNKGKVRCTRCGHIFEVARPEEDDFIHVDLSDGALLDEESPAASPPTAPSPSFPKLKKTRSLKIPAILLIAFLVLGGGLFWLLKDGDSPSSSGMDSQEKVSTAEELHPSVTILDSTQAYFLENSHGGQIFVVEGEIANESSKPVSFILLEGKLYTKNNHVAQSQRCFSGNPLTREELIKLNITDIQNRMMNREGKDLMNVNIPTSKRIPFMLIFHNLPELDALSDYSIEVISAKAG